MENMKTFYSTLVLVIISFASKSQTNISGVYFSDVTWTASGSPYTVIGDVQIAPGVELTIEPGIEIEFKDNYQILVKGGLQMNGTSGAPIKISGIGLFTNNTYDTTVAMVFFRSADLTNSSISYVEFTGPRKSIQLADEQFVQQDLIQNSGLLSIHNCLFNHTKIETKGFDANASVLLDTIEFTNVEIYCSPPYGGNIEIRNSNINGGNMFIDAYNYNEVTLKNTVVDGTTIILGCCNSKINVEKSAFTNSHIQNYGSENMAYIEGSDFINTPILLTSATASGSPKHNGFVIRNSKFDFTFTPAHPFGIYASSLDISCSSIHGNGIGASIEIFGDPVDPLVANKIYNCTFSNNYVGIKNSTLNNPVQIDSNNFINSASYHLINAVSTSLEVKNNWWGSTDSATIHSKILDYYNNLNYGIVDFSDYLVMEKTVQVCPEIITHVITPNINTTQSTSINIYPNPTEGNFSIQVEGFNDPETLLQLSNSMGKVVFSTSLNKSMKEVKVDINDLEKGIYFCNIISGNVIQSRKIFIQ